MGGCNHYQQIHSRRDFLNKSAYGLGALSLASLLSPTDIFAGSADAKTGVLESTHFPAQAKQVIYLFQSGAPSQLPTHQMNQNISMIFMDLIQKFQVLMPQIVYWPED